MALCVCFNLFFLHCSGHPLELISVIRVIRGAPGPIGGINKWDEDLSFDTLKEIENYWSVNIPEKKFDESSPKEKWYILSMFPYPSGNLHLGHIKVYGTGDFLARYFRMKGKNVLHPMGWDAFGLPAENAALERGVDPNEWTQKNIAAMKSVMEKFNFSFDWDREFATCDSEYYRWTQFFFVKLYKMGLVYRKRAYVNWDPVDQTVLADEQVDVNGCSWRSGAAVEKKLLRQWFVRTTAFAKSLLDGLQDPALEGWKDVLDIQRHWIGDVNGTTIDFELVNGGPGNETKMPIWMKNPEYIDKAKFVAVKANSYWTLGRDVSGLMHYQVKNPFTGEILPVYQTDLDLFPEGSEVHLGIPEVRERDREFADSFKIRYPPGGSFLAEGGELLKLREEICAEARRREIGGHPASSNLRDWLVSRQRYWGTPIPIVYCDVCGELPVPEEDLPVRLPAARSNAKGANPLTENREWMKATCPNCGGEAVRETDTMDTFVDSSWYFLRFLDPDNQEAAFDVKKVKQLAPVDVYVGGKEHATLHLFYARFMNHFLHSLGLVPRREPFTRFLSQGVVKSVTYRSRATGKYVKSESVQAKDDGFFDVETNEILVKQWEKMSKSKCNSVEPTNLIAKYGVDALRMLVLRASSPKSELHWNEELVLDIFRWQRKLWLTVAGFIKLRRLNGIKPEETEEYKALDYYIYDSRNFYLNTITRTIENFYDVGTALRKLQGLTGCFRKCTDDVVAHSLQYERALAVHIILLAPCAPYFASELWAGFASAPNKLCHSGEILWDRSVFDQPWPRVDPDYRNVSLDSGGVENNAYLNKIIKIKADRLQKAIHKRFKKSKKSTSEKEVGSPLENTGTR